MKRKIVLAVCLCLALLGAFSLAHIVFAQESKTIQMTAEGTLYDMSGEGRQDTCEVTVQGEYRKSISRSDSFTGYIAIDSNTLKLNEKIAELSFFDNIAIPSAGVKLGYRYTSRIHSIIWAGEPFENFVIVLYNEYVLRDKIFEKIGQDF